jgi:hypothetical protein
MERVREHKSANTHRRDIAKQMVVEEKIWKQRKRKFNSC